MGEMLSHLKKKKKKIFFFSKTIYLCSSLNNFCFIIFSLCFLILGEGWILQLAGSQFSDQGLDQATLVKVSNPNH